MLGGGQVYLFHTPPEQVETGVNAPLFGELSEAPDEFVLHLDEGDTTPTVTDRVKEMVIRFGLNPSQLRKFSTIGIDVLEDLQRKTDQAVEIGADLSWNTFPLYRQVEALCEIVCSVKQPSRFGCRSSKQLAFYIKELRESISMVRFFAKHSESYRGNPRGIDNIFKFLRAAEFDLPEYFAVIELFVQRKYAETNYSLLLAELPRWFRAEPLKILEEQGVPIQISERFIMPNDTVTSLGARLREVALGGDSRLSSLEQEWVLDALPA